MLNGVFKYTVNFMHTAPPSLRVASTMLRLLCGWHTPALYWFSPAQETVMVFDLSTARPLVRKINDSWFYSSYFKHKLYVLCKLISFSYWVTSYTSDTCSSNLLFNKTFSPWWSQMLLQYSNGNGFLKALVARKIDHTILPPPLLPLPILLHLQPQLFSPYEVGGENFGDKYFTNRLARPNDWLKVAGIYNSFRIWHWW